MCKPVASVRPELFLVDIVSCFMYRHKVVTVDTKESNMKPLTLEQADWLEIYEALESKAARIEAGEYNEGQDDSERQRWAKHIRNIIATIGPDGIAAAAYGVAKAI
jgi:hypothetical protein